MFIANKASNIICSTYCLSI